MTRACIGAPQTERCDRAIAFSRFDPPILGVLIGVRVERNDGIARGQAAEVTRLTGISANTS